MEMGGELDEGMGGGMGGWLNRGKGGGMDVGISAWLTKGMG